MAAALDVIPACANWAARTPLRAASPAWSGFTIVPKFSLRPEASDAAIASACPAVFASSPNRRDTAAAAPIVPSVDVQCQPRW